MPAAPRHHYCSRTFRLTMKLLLLTTETPHHVYFARELTRLFGSLTVFCETDGAPIYSFETFHPFEAARDTFEWQHWFNGEQKKLSEITPVRFFDNINNSLAITALKQEKPDIVIVFGTGILRPATIAACPSNLFNLHGGDPEHYRGLDTHLWSIYHRDFASLITTLHKLDANLDTGEIIFQSQISLEHGMPLHKLRAKNTEICVKLSLAVIDMYGRHGSVTSRPQRTVGRYYSAMPSALKAVCLQHFSTYVNRIKDGK